MELDTMQEISESARMVEWSDFTATERNALTEQEQEMTRWVVGMFAMYTTHEAIAYARELLAGRS